jgi:hypothetical protein
VIWEELATPLRAIIDPVPGPAPVHETVTEPVSVPVATFQQIIAVRSELTEDPVSSRVKPEGVAIAAGTPFAADSKMTCPATSPVGYGITTEVPLLVATWESVPAVGVAMPGHLRSLNY